MNSTDLLKTGGGNRRGWFRSGGDESEPSPAAARQLAGLRLRLAALLAALVLGVVAVFAYAVIRLDRQLRAEQLNADLLAQIESIDRRLTFIDGTLEPEDPREVLFDNAAVVVEAEFDAVEIADERGLWEEFDTEAYEARIPELIEEVFFDLDDEEQRTLLLLAEIEGETREARVANLLAEPTPELLREAEERFIVEEARRREIDLAEPIDAFLGAGLVGLDDEVIELAFEVMDGDDSEIIYRTFDQQEIALRGTVLVDEFTRRGAVLAFVDVGASEQAHRQFRNRIFGLAVALVSLATLAAWWLAGRSIRPAAAALGQQERFLSAAAHELRTPVAAIRATAEAPVGPAGAGPPLARVAELAASASRLTDDLLTLARMDADRVELETTPTRLDYLVEAALDGNPAFRLLAAQIVVDADVALLTRALDNVFINAVTHGGASAASPAQVVVDQQGVTVTDSGPGIPPELLDTLFDRFRSRAGSPGHGLGLPLARWIARAHGGDLVAQNHSDSHSHSYSDSHSQPDTITGTNVDLSPGSAGDRVQGGARLTLRLATRPA